jgi:hypothetical protein
VKLVISDAHEGLKAAIAKVLHATWQLAALPRASDAQPARLCPRHGRGVASAFIATAEAAKAQWRKVADQLRPKLLLIARATAEGERIEVRRQWLTQEELDAGSSLEGRRDHVVGSPPLNDARTAGHYYLPLGSIRNRTNIAGLHAPQDLKRERK